MEDNVSGDDDTVRREMEAPIASMVTQRIERGASFWGIVEDILGITCIAENPKVSVGGVDTMQSKVRSM